MNWKWILLLAAIAWAVAPASADQASPGIVPALEIVAKIQRGEPVLYDHVVIEGYLHLNRSDTTKSKASAENGDAVLDQGQKSRMSVASPITITNSLIKGNADFDFADFRAPVSFEGTNFSNGVSFREARFDEDAYFSKTEHSGYVNFWMAKFMKSANFEDVSFKGYADFRCAEFNGSASFLGDQFYRDAKFYKATFLGPTYFNVVRFDRDANFGNTWFKETADFEYSVFNGYSDFRYANFGKDANFRGAKFNGSADFRDSLLSGDADFMETSYQTDFDVRGLRFSSLRTSWPSIGDRLISDGPVYLQLIKNFKILEQFDDANSCYYQYRIHGMNAKSWSDTEKYIDLLGWVTCGFGVRPGFTLLWMLIVIVFFASLYWSLDVFKEQPYPFAQINSKYLKNATIVDAAMDIFREQPNISSSIQHSTTIVDALIFSAALFFTLPPPFDFIKSRHFRVLYVLEDITGWLIMSLFLVTLLNVIIRS